MVGTAILLCWMGDGSMMTRRGVLGVLAGGAALALGGCGSPGKASYRFRMTVEVETPQGIKTGSSVYQVRAMNRTDIGSEAAKREWLMDGQALVIDMPDGRAIFVLMKTEDSSINDLAKMSMKTLDPAFKNDIVESAGRLGGWSTHAGEVPRQYYPLMVRFRDLNDPKSVERVDPKAAGVKRIMLETTGDDVTTGIKERLGWLSDGGLTLNPGGRPTVSPSFAGTLRQRYFSTEIPR
jgi:hypothetical protein